MSRKSFDEFEQHEQTEILDKARAWYAEHKDHVDRLAKSSKTVAGAPVRFAPSGSDCWNPELWKEGSWAWFLRMELEEKIRQIVADQAGQLASAISMETKLRDELNADSLDFVELRMEIEDEYNMMVWDEDALKWWTVRDIVDFVEKRKQEFV